MQIYYQTKDGQYICFKHAVIRAVEKGEKISTCLDDHSSSYYMGDDHCVDCKEEENQ